MCDLCASNLTYSKKGTNLIFSIDREQYGSLERDTSNISDYIMVPEKRLLSNDDMELWEKCQTKQNLLDFVTDLAESVKGLENTQYVEPISEPVKQTMDLLAKVNGLVEKHPVSIDANVSRFGKTEFRDFYDDLKSQSKLLIQSSFPSLTSEQVEQLHTYLDESWGNGQRLDYGSGHELNFIGFLYGLTQYKVFNLKEDAANLVLKIFIEYIHVMRLLETQYWLEPAGSHGVWGLDDYHFLPFLFGAYQLVTHKHLKPTSIHNKEIVEMFEEKYMYFGCIAFINSIKTTASLRWHSPMLDDISGVKRWSKVAEGMIKMYKAEVMSKLPIMQHFYFSEFLKPPEGVSEPRSHNHEDEEDACCPGDRVSTWGDCCGIKVPSAIAATQMSKTAHKLLPFD